MAAWAVVVQQGLAVCLYRFGIRLVDRTTFRIVSGGQTGVDRTALDWAMAHHIPHGGWCPAGRTAEDGVIPDRYALTEMPNQGGYAQRTEANVRDSDATLIVSLAPTLSEGSLATRDFASQLRKHCIHIHPAEGWKTRLDQWWRDHPIQILNVAGPRASHEPGVMLFTREVLDEVLECHEVSSNAVKETQHDSITRLSEDLA
jgi:hypothetical protein